MRDAEGLGAKGRGLRVAGRGWAEVAMVRFNVSVVAVDGDAPSGGAVPEQVIEEIDRAGVAYRLSGADAVVEGDWEVVIPVLQRADARLRAVNDRVFMVLSTDDHEGAR